MILELPFYCIATACADIDYLLNVDTEVQQCSSAQFLLELKESRQVSQVVINDVLGWNGLFASTVERIHARVRDKLASIGIDPDNIEVLLEVFSDLPHPFNELETEHKQNKYYREHMGLVGSICHSTV